MRGQLCLYKVIEWEFHFLYLVHADNILLVNSVVNRPHEENKFLPSKFKRMFLVECLSLYGSRFTEKRIKGILGVTHGHAKESF